MAYIGPIIKLTCLIAACLQRRRTNRVREGKKLNLLLVGKTAALRRLIRECMFKETEVTPAGETEKTHCQFGNVLEFRVEVVEVPGFGDCDKNKEEDISWIAEQLKVAIEKNPDGYDTILIAIQLDKVTSTDKLIFAQLNQLFGEGFTERNGVLVVTDCHTYQASEHQGLSFDQWWHSADKLLKEMMEECGRRAVILKSERDNRNQLLRLLNFVFSLMAGGGARPLPDLFSLVSANQQSEGGQRSLTDELKKRLRAALETFQSRIS